jgi:3-hydroxyisobutyryl-CoA hydrolase
MHFRIATENTKFLMPETKIGSYTDSGGSYILPRMEGNLGVYLGLTRNSFQAEDVL